MKFSIFSVLFTMIFSAGIAGAAQPIILKSLSGQAFSAVADEIGTYRGMGTIRFRENAKGKTVADFVNWQGYGQVWMLDVPVALEGSNTLTLDIGQWQKCAYDVNEIKENGLRKSLKLVDRKENDNLSLVTCPREITWKGAAAAPGRPNLNAVWRAKDNCETCQVEFSKSGNQITANFTHWRWDSFSKESIYRKDMPVTFDPATGYLVIQYSSELRTWDIVASRAECAYYAISDELLITQKAQNYILGVCPDNITLK